MIKNHEQRIVEDFQDWVTRGAKINLIENSTPEQVLETYLDMLGNIIADSEVSLESIISSAMERK